MLQFMNSPAWFYGFDNTIDFFSVIVLVIIALVSARYYTYFRLEKNYLKLACGYTLLAASFVCKIIGAWLVHDMVLGTKAGGIIVFSGQEVSEHFLLFNITYLLHPLLFIMGIYLLYTIAHSQTKENHALFLILIAASALFTNEHYYVLHGLVFVFLFLLTSNYVARYFETKLTSTLWLAYSFGLLAFSSFVFMLVAISGLLYVIAESLQLIGFFALLITFILVLRHGKKPLKTRHHA